MGEVSSWNPYEFGLSEERIAQIVNFPLEWNKTIPKKIPV